jgi:hypothetical protein
MLTFCTVAIFLRRLNERYSADGLSEGATRRSRVCIVYFTQNSQTPRRESHTLEDTMSYPVQDLIPYLPASPHAADKSGRPFFRSRINVESDCRK